MRTATPEQRDVILRSIEDMKRFGEAEYSIEVRYTTYIGPDCAAERGAITICADGRIHSLVYPNGGVSV
jgi:hypothetical protein